MSSQWTPLQNCVETVVSKNWTAPGIFDQPVKYQGPRYPWIILLGFKAAVTVGQPIGKVACSDWFILKIFLASWQKSQWSVYQQKSLAKFGTRIDAEEKDWRTSEGFPKWQTFVDNVLVTFESISNLETYPVLRLTIYEGPDSRWVSLV